MDTWKRVPVSKAIEKKMQIITCCKCKDPAVALDHHFPYDNYHNRCAKHWGETDK
jgi:hypothetical protein